MIAKLLKFSLAREFYASRPDLYLPDATRRKLYDCLATCINDGLKFRAFFEVGDTVYCVADFPGARGVYVMEGNHWGAFPAEGTNSRYLTGDFFEPVIQMGDQSFAGADLLMDAAAECMRNSA